MNSLGLQEYIEAATFLAFNEDGRLATLAELEEAIALPEKPSEPAEGDAGAEVQRNLPLRHNRVPSA